MGIIKRLRLPVLLVTVVVLYGVLGYMFIEKWSLMDALYMTLTVLSTVGFSEVRPLDTSGKIFTMSLMVLGVAAVLVVISVVAGWVAAGQLGIRGRRRRMQRRIDGLKDHFIVCAYGRVGRSVARQLESAGMPFVVIDVKEELEPLMVADRVTYLIGDPSSETVLRSAGIERAKGLVCAVDSDATNVYITLMARAVNAKLFIVARASEPGSDERLRRAGADRVVSPFVSSGRHMALLALRPRIVDYLDLAATGGRSVRIEELQLEEGSPQVGRTIAQACGQAAVLAVRHAGGEISPAPPIDLQLQPGDLLLLLGEEEILRPVEQS